MLLGNYKTTWIKIKYFSMTYTRIPRIWYLNLQNYFEFKWLMLQKHCSTHFPDYVREELVSQGRRQKYNSEVLLLIVLPNKMFSVWVESRTSSFVELPQNWSNLDFEEEYIVPRKLWYEIIKISIFIVCKSGKMGSYYPKKSYWGYFLR